MKNLGWSFAARVGSCALFVVALESSALAWLNRPGVPELDPGMAGNGLALLAGGLLLLVDRYRSRRK
jgi:hypothetical protein